MTTNIERPHSGPITGIVFVILLFIVASFAYHWTLGSGPTVSQQAANDVAQGVNHAWHDYGHGDAGQRFRNWLNRQNTDFHRSTY